MTDVKACIKCVIDTILSIPKFISLAFRAMIR